MRRTTQIWLACCSVVATAACAQSIRGCRWLAISQEIRSQHGSMNTVTIVSLEISALMLPNSKW